jgi:hypothetical protein
LQLAEWFLRRRFLCEFPIGSYVVRDSSAVRRLFVRLAGAVGCQSALHNENSGFAAPTLSRHISTFRGYRILFSIRNPYINRFTNHFSIQLQPNFGGMVLGWPPSKIVFGDPDIQPR